MSPATTRWPDEQPTRFTEQDFNKFLEWCYDQDASDLMVEAGEPLKAKIHGRMRRVGSRLIRYEEIANILRQIYQPSAPAQLKSGQDLDFAHAVMRQDESIIRFRVNATACRAARGSDDGVEIVMRTIPGVPLTCEQLGVEREVIDACSAKYGIVLVSGPTGSGKSTLIASLLGKKASDEPLHILTYEAPIEFDLKAIPNRKASIVQTEIPTHIESFAKACANSLRRAPDVVFFGEARNRETIAGCVRESQTGHLVFSTVHTNDVSGTISRMVDEFDATERRGTTSKLVDAMRMIVHQRLVPKMGGGRVALREFLVFTEAMRRHLQKQLLKHDDLGGDIQALVEAHGRTLLADAQDKFRQGLIDLDQYLLLVNELGSPEDLAIVPEVADDLCRRDVITEEVRRQWIFDAEEITGAQLRRPAVAK
jgi:defect-in-organelle-trafficking protein DotB